MVNSLAQRYEVPDMAYNRLVNRRDSMISIMGSSTNVLAPVKIEPEKVAPHLYKFTHKEDCFKFGVIGMYNTRRENAFFSIIACIGNEEIEFNRPNWD
jgi:hypothetical protein